MTKRDFGKLLCAFCAGLAVAWLVEALTVGVGVISRYLGPVAIIGSFLALFLMRSKRDG